MNEEDLYDNLEEGSSERIVIPYTPHQWQAEAELLFQIYHYITLVIPRQSGKTKFAAYMLIEKTLLSLTRGATVAYICPEKEQGGRNIWNKLVELLINVPWARFDTKEYKITFPEINNSTIYILGTTKASNLRGLTLDFVVMDEVAQMPPDVWHEIVYPMLIVRDGKALFIGTPKGYNMFYDFYMNGMSKEPGWGSMLHTIDTVGLYSEEERARIIASYKGRDELLQQEMYCSFNASVNGSYYGRYITKAEQDGRITRVPHIPSKPVVVSWDIGLDSTVVWFAQEVEGRVHVIDFLIYDNMELHEVAAIVNNKPYTYLGDILPHDGDHRNVGNILSRKNILKSCGRKILKLLPRSSIGEGITETRNFIDKCFFDRLHCADGIKSLTLYAARSHNSSGTFEESIPKKSKHNHAADAFRYLALGFKYAIMKSRELDGSSVLNNNSLYHKNGVYTSREGGTPLRISEWDPLHSINKR